MPKVAGSGYDMAAMRYISTRGRTVPHSYADVLLAGLAPDGGLFLPDTWPQIGADEISDSRGSLTPKSRTRC